MTKPTEKRLGCLFVVMLIVIPMAYLSSLGWVRTTRPVARPLESGNLVIQLEAADFQEAIGLWPIVATVTYPDAGRIRGKIANRMGRDRISDYRVTILPSQGLTKNVRCRHDYRDACYFVADLANADLTKGLTLSVIDIHNRKVIMPPKFINFTRDSTYSFAMWDALMSV